MTCGWRAQLDDGIYKDFTKDQAFKNPGEAGYRPKPPPATASAAPAPGLARAPRSRPARLLVPPACVTVTAASWGSERGVFAVRRLVHLRLCSMCSAGVCMGHNTGVLSHLHAIPLFKIFVTSKQSSTISQNA